MAEVLVEPVVEEGVSAIIAFISKQLGYLFLYSSNMKRLKNLVRDLHDRNVEVDRCVARADWNNEIILPAVRTWLERVKERKLSMEKDTRDADEYGQGCCTKNSINLKLRYRLSRNAVKNAVELVDLLANGTFETYAEPPLPPGIVPEPSGISTTFDQGTVNINTEVVSLSNPSRLILLTKVLKAIEDDTSRIIGIYGLGGMGKSTLMKDVIRKIEDKILVVDEYALSDGNSEVVESRIQDDIAKYLGLTFQEQNDLVLRANELRRRLTQKRKGLEGKFKKILIILDNLGSAVDLDKVGIPSGNNLHDCKIVLVSRSSFVCQQMNAIKIFAIPPLGDEEAWSLFQKFAKTDIHPGDSRYSIGKDILKQCDGSPLAIVTNAVGLINKGRDEWINSHKLLVSSEFDGEYAAANKALKVRYDKLESKEIQRLFLLCCIFPEGFSIPIKDLTRYGWGFQMFNGIENIQGAKDRVTNHVEVLRSSNLLEASQSTVLVTLHDLVREFGLWISDSGENLFMVKFGNGVQTWPNDGTYESCTMISIQCDELGVFHDNPSCPNLILLQLIHRKEFRQSKLPDRFLEAMEKLQVLAMRNMSIPKFDYLANIRTLSLDNCKFVYTLSPMLGYLEQLEILSCVNSNIKEFPVEAMKLTRLRLLDLTGCKEFHRIAPGVLKCLGSLEILLTRGASMCWSEQNNTDGEIYASFSEFKTLSNLKLQIEIPYQVFSIGCAKVPGFFSNVGNDEY